MIDDDNGNGRIVKIDTSYNVQTLAQQASAYAIAWISNRLFVTCSSSDAMNVFEIDGGIAYSIGKTELSPIGPTNGIAADPANSEYAYIVQPSVNSGIFSGIRIYSIKLEITSDGAYRYLKYRNDSSEFQGVGPVIVNPDNTAVVAGDGYLHFFSIDPTNGYQWSLVESRTVGINIRWFERNPITGVYICSDEYK